MSGFRFGMRKNRPAHQMGIGWFIAEDGAYTTLAAAVSILVVLALMFSAATAAWTMSRAGDVQTSADTSALAGANVVSSYYTAATVVDASILSLGLTGMVVVGAGLAGLLVPGVNVAAGEAIDAGVRMLQTRNQFATSASKGLKTLEAALPYLVAANASRTCSASSTDSITYSGTALAVPLKSASDFPALEGEQIATEALEQAGDELDQIADELARAAEASAAAKEKAWIADCGRAGFNMQERAANLTSLSASENPDYASSVTWDSVVALNRARCYYRWRRDNDVSVGTSVEARADAAARHAYYSFAAAQLEAAYIEETDDSFVYDVPLLPKNMSEVKSTTLYTNAVWPSSFEDAGLTLHFDATCPGATGASGPSLALSAIDAGSAQECKVCKFSVGDVGKTPMASTSVDNGFEYHLREFTLALADYADARNHELELEASACTQAEQASSAFDEALSVLSAKRPRIAPPGRNGCVALVVSGDVESPDELQSAFNEDTSLGTRGAVSAAVLASDAASAENNILGRFFSGLEERTGGSTVAVLGDDLMDLWGDLLMGYGDLSSALDNLMDELLGGLSAWGAGSIATWLGERVRQSLTALGFEPVDLSFRKPVLTDSAHVLTSADMPALTNVQEALRSIPLGTTDVGDILQALGYEATEYITSAQFTLAEIPLPQGGSIPLTIRVQDLAGAL